MIDIKKIFEEIKETEERIKEKEIRNHIADIKDEIEKQLNICKEDIEQLIKIFSDKSLIKIQTYSVKRLNSRDNFQFCFKDEKCKPTKELLTLAKHHYYFYQDCNECDDKNLSLEQRNDLKDFAIRCGNELQKLYKEKIGYYIELNFDEDNQRGNEGRNTIVYVNFYDTEIKNQNEE